MATYDSEITELTDIQSGWTLAQANHAKRHNDKNAALRALAGHLDGLQDAHPQANVGLTIVEVTAGVWSGDAPPNRSNGANPVWFIPLDPANPTNPSDPTDGIDTPANIRAWDRVGPVLVDTL